MKETDDGLGQDRQSVKGLAFEGFLLVRMSQQRKSNNGANYLDMTLADNSGDINAKVWDPLAAPPD